MLTGILDKKKEASNYGKIVLAPLRKQLGYYVNYYLLIW